jgi:hypothetical protein
MKEKISRKNNLTLFLENKKRFFLAFSFFTFFPKGGLRIFL